MIATVFAAPFQLSAEEPVLANAIPDDVLLFVVGHHNPESAFIDDYWQDILNAVKDSGAGEDVMAMVGSLIGMEEMAELQRLKARASQLLDGVNWEQLHKNDMVFAERLPVSMRAGSIPLMGPANMVWISRGADETAVTSNFQALVEILEAIVEEINGYSGEDRLAVKRTTKGAAEIASANLLGGLRRAPDLTLITARRGDLLIIALGEPLLADVLEMLDKPGGRRSLADDPRFRSVFNELPAAENALTFFNVQGLVRPMRQFSGHLAAEIGSSSDEYENTGMSPEARRLHRESMEVYQAGEYEAALKLAHQAWSIDKNNSILTYNLACFNALAGRIEEALTWLEKAVEAGFYAPNKIASDSDLDRLRAHQRYKAVLALATTKAQEQNVKDEVVNSSKSGEAFKLTSEAWRIYETPGAGKREYEQALQLVKQAYEIAPEDSRVLYYSACFHALLGHTEKALHFLDKAVDGGFYSPNFISEDPDLESIRDTKRYREAVARARTKAAQSAGGQATGKAALVTGIFDRLIDIAGVFDYVASVEKTDGHSVHTETIAALVPGAEHRPIYKVFGQSRPLEKFDRHLPKETLSFSVSSGLDADALYAFLEETVSDAGPSGKKVLQKWAEVQDKIGLNFRKDILSWVGSECMHVTLEDEAGWIMLMKVHDEQQARDGVGNLLDLLTKNLNDAMTRIPQLATLAMVMPRRSPLSHDVLDGFENLHFGMSPIPIVWGVADGYLIIGATADAAALCLETARGGHPNIRDNPRIMAEILLPAGRCTSISLTDRRGLGKEIAQMLGFVSIGMGSMAMFMPANEETQKLKSVLTPLTGIIGKLVPAAQKIDFYKSSSACTVFDGRAWHTRQVTHYFSPEERAARKPPPVATKPDADGL
jgi:hypothetical protein